MSEQNNSDEIGKSKKSSDLKSYLVVAGILAAVAVVSVVLTILPKFPTIDIYSVLNRVWAYSLGFSGDGSSAGFYLYHLVSTAIFISPVLIVKYLRRKRRK